MNWQQILIRLLVSAAAGVATTGAVVVSAENGPRPKSKRRKRRRRRPRPGSAAERRYERKRKRHRKKSRREAEAAVSDPGGLATKHLAATAEPGLSTDEFIARLKGTGTSAKNRVGRMFGFGPAEPEVPVQTEDEDRSRVAKADRGRKDKGRRRRPKQTREDGLEALKQDVMYLAKDKVKKSVVDAVGVGDKVEAIKDVAEEIGDRAGDVGRAIAEGAKGGAGKLGDAAGTVARGAGELASSVRESIPEDGVEAVGEGVRGLGRWLQGPGAQDYDRSRRRPELTEGLNEGVFIVAPKLEGRVIGEQDLLPPPTRPAPNASSDEEAPPADQPGPSGRALGASAEAGPWHPPQERDGPEADDDRWTTVEPGARLPSQAPGLRAPSSGQIVDATLVDPASAPAQASVADGVEPLSEDKAADDKAADDKAADGQAVTGPQSDEPAVFEAKVDDDAPEPVRRHRSEGS